MTDDRDFTRQSFLGQQAEELLANVRVAIVGLGGGGSHIAQQLAHVGVGHYRLIDPDNIEASNLNRLVGASKVDVDRAIAKVEIAERTIKAIRPWADVVLAKKKWQEADHLLRDANVLFGCIDGYQQRDYLETAARRFGIPYIDIGMDVADIGNGSFAVAGQMIMTMPGGPCMRCLGFLNPDKLAREENRYGDAGINPQVVWTNGVLASLAVGAFMKLVTPWWPNDDGFTWLELDGNRQIISPSQQPEYTPRKSVCPHHGGPEGLGDPFFKLRGEAM
ncbi:MAG: ThiF family adenylyltransferase [Mesorhizobium sp.]|nr:MAG: ThiF family adenylyltransferase [Mesorhizobium sp.]